METNYFFNPAQELPVIALNTQNNFNENWSNPTQEYMSDVARNLEAELNTRMGMMDQTSMVTITGLDGTIMYANDLFCSISGFSRKELIGNSHSLIRHPDLCEETVEGLWKVIRGGDSWNGIMKSKAKNGENFWSKTTVSPVFDSENNPVKYIWLRQDITELKKTENELYEAKQRADQQLLDNLKNASRIHSSIMPSEKELQEFFPKAFMIVSPLHNVSGDFCWFTKKDKNAVFMLGDGTGHGISGSFVSLMTLSALEYIVNHKREVVPGKILVEVNDFLFKAMNKHKDSGLTESVDMAICSLNTETKELHYASGKSKIYLVRKDEIYFLDKDEISIGTVEKGAAHINTRSMIMQKGDRVFMMSDGFADQFGGERNKRIGSKNVKELLTSTGYLSVEDQKEYIRKYFNAWKGENEQTDDFSMLAFQVD
jgi:PAS domain S-box-containing protein